MQPDDAQENATTSTIPNDEWNGPWGAIEPIPYSVETLCIQVEQQPGRPRIYYYPYRTIGKWNWNMATPEVLEIQMGGIQVTISGTGLRRLADALNLGQLRVIRFNQTGEPVHDIWVRSIIIDNLQVLV